ncbi:MAG: hypothetical protein HDR21_03665 [Lachnospiraceae bacterium]|nr:hypothetical protein [Lachnospiraceae bacterium]MBD5482509.1 hypothetical protein [Lachnospiraceae bacterium]
MELEPKRKQKLISQLNKISFVGLEGIKVGDVLSTALWHVSKWTKESVRNIGLCMTESFSIKKRGENPECAFLYSHSHLSRKDHLTQFQAVESLFQNKVVITASENRTARPKWNPYILLLPIWRMQMKHLACPDYIKNGLCRRLCRSAAYAEEMFQIIKRYPSVRKLIFFFDVLEIDSILVQKCNQKSYTTYTLEHGIVNGTYDYIDYKCSNARYLLLWGEYSKQTAVQCGIAENRIILVGNINTLVKSTSPIYVDKKHIQISRFIVCLAIVLTKKDWQKNKSLIEIADFLADKYNATYILKVHPSDKVTNYTSCVNPNYCKKTYDNRTRLNELFEDVDFLLCGNSTTFGDAVYCGIPAFRYIRDEDVDGDVCKGISWGKADSRQGMDALLKNMQNDPDAYMEQLRKVRRFLYGEDNPKERYYSAITENV